MLSELFVPKYSLNIDRSSLPQVKTADVRDYLHWMQKNKNIHCIQTHLPANHLTPSQGHFNKSKVEHFLTLDRKDLNQPIIVSADYIICDGHHRWLALLNMDPHAEVPVYKMSVNFPELLKATQEYPKSFTKSVVESFRTLTESVEKHSVLTFGRMNPPTSGHSKLVHKVHEVAQEHHADHHVVLSHSHDSEKNPLSPGDKLKHAKHAFPGTHVTTSSPKHPTIFHHAALLHKAGTKHLHVVVGSDRVKEFHDSLHKYNGHFDKEGHGYHFKSITVHSAGHRDPDAKGVEGMSASKMREHAKAGNFHRFKQGVAPTVSHAHAKELYDDVRKGQTVNEEVKKPFPLNTKWATLKTKSAPTPSKDEQHRKYDQEERDSHVKEDYMDQMPEKRGKFPVSYTQKPNPKCKDCDGTGYETKYHSWGTHSQSPCVCTQLKESVDYLADQVHADMLDYLTEHVHDAGIFKAIHLAGAPGSGKDFVLKKALQGHGLTEVDAETALKHLSDHGKAKGEGPQKAKSIKELRQRLALQGRNGLIINHSSANAAQTKKIKDLLDGLGYENKMVFVDAADNVSRNRNVERGQSGGRMIPEKQRAEKWRKAQDARVALSKMFGGEHYHEFNNDEDLRHNADPEIQGQKTSELEDLHKTVKKFAQTPPVHPVAQEWVYKNLSKLAKQPVGNKAQQKSQVPPTKDSATAEDARKLGLSYYGKGRYGKNGSISHFALNGKLIEKKKALTLPKSMKDKEKEAKEKAAPKKKKSINEEFDALFTEEHDDAYDYPDLLEETDSLVHGKQHLTDAPGGTRIGDQENGLFESLSDTGIAPDDYDLLGDIGSGGAGTLQEEKEGQEEKVDYRTFIDRLGRQLVLQGNKTQEGLQEANAVDTMETGGPALGGLPAETHDMTNGGQVTTGAKKAFKDIRRK